MFCCAEMWTFPIGVASCQRNGCSFFHVILSTLRKTFSRWHFEILFYFSREQSLILHVKLSPIFTKCQRLVSGKYEKHYQFVTCSIFPESGKGKWRFISFLNCLPHEDENIWASAWQTYMKTCATSKDSDQPAHSRSLIRVFADPMCLLQPQNYPKRDTREPLPYNSVLCPFQHYLNHIETTERE